MEVRNNGKNSALLLKSTRNIPVDVDDFILARRRDLTTLAIQLHYFLRIYILHSLARCDVNSILLADPKLEFSTMKFGNLLLFGYSTIIYYLIAKTFYSFLILIVFNIIRQVSNRILNCKLKNSYNRGICLGIEIYPLTLSSFYTIY